MTIKRESTRINGYVGFYDGEASAKPSFRVEIYKVGLFKKKLIKRYYLIYHVFRTIGSNERKFGRPSVAKEYGDVVNGGYKYSESIEQYSLKRLKSFIADCMFEHKN